MAVVSPRPNGLRSTRIVSDAFNILTRTAKDFWDGVLFSGGSREGLTLSAFNFFFQLDQDATISCLETESTLVAPGTVWTWPNCTELAGELR